MARFNEILVGRFNRAVQKLFAIKGGPPTAQVSSEVGVQIPFGQMGADFRYLEGWALFAAAINLAPSVGNANGVQFSLDNPNVPRITNIVAVLTRLQIITSLADVITVSENFAPNLNLTNVGTGIRLDSRGSRSASALNVSSSQGVIPAFGFTINQFSTQPNVPYEIILPDEMGIPMNGIHNIRLNSLVPTLNVQWYVNVWFRERFLEDSERT